MQGRFGSLVQQRDGTVSCKLVKQLSGQCSGVVPNRVKSSSAEKTLLSRNHYYYFEGDRSGGWPTHDPCGNNQANQLKGVANPHGIFSFVKLDLDVYSGFIIMIIMIRYII